MEYIIASVVSCRHLKCLHAIWWLCLGRLMACRSYVFLRLTNPNTVRLHRLVTMKAVHPMHLRIHKMNKLNPFPNRYRPLQTNLTDTTPLIIDTEANPQDILESALQRSAPNPALPKLPRRRHRRHPAHHPRALPANPGRLRPAQSRPTTHAQLESASLTLFSQRAEVKLFRLFQH